MCCFWMFLDDQGVGEMRSGPAGPGHLGETNSFFLYGKISIEMIAKSTNHHGHLSPKQTGKYSIRNHRHNMVPEIGQWMWKNV